MPINDMKCKYVYVYFSFALLIKYIAQHVFQPALTGRLELILRKIVSSEQEQRLSRWADFAKNYLPLIECKELPRFREKYRALRRHVCKIREIGGQKNGVQHATAIYPIPRYTRPRYIGLTLYVGWSFEIQVPVDGIYGHLIFKWVT